MAIIVERVEQPEAIGWDDFVTRCPEGTIFQTTLWGRFLTEGSGNQRAAVYLAAMDEQRRVVATALCFCESPVAGLRVPRTLEQSINAAARRMGWLKGYCLYGPLVHEEVESARSITALLRAWAEFSHTEGLLSISKVTPPIHSSEAQHRMLTFTDEAQRAGYENAEWATVLLDLGAPLETLWRKLKPSARKAVKACHRRGLKVENLGRDELPAYEVLLRETRSHLKIPMPPHYPNKTMWDVLRQGNSTLEVFSVREGRELLGALGVIAFNGIIFELAWAQSAASLERRLYVGDLIRWAIIQWGRANGYRLYDLSGISPNPKNIKERGIRQFKEKWGGVAITYPYSFQVLRPRLLGWLRLGSEVANRLF